jgi:hypothetical protein
MGQSQFLESLAENILKEPSDVSVISYTLHRLFYQIKTQYPGVPSYRLIQVQNTNGYMVYGSWVMVMMFM